MSTLSIVIQLILSLSILVTLHECGHFFPAKWFKTKVEKFYLFFNPYFSIWKKQIGETEYGLGWIPFGGYVKIAGMIDESMDKEQMKQPVQPWQFRAKPAWQRLIIMLGGVIVNFILGFLIFAMMFWYYGTSYIDNNSVADYGIKVEELGKQIGLQDGDHVVSIDDIKMERFEPSLLAKEIILNNPKYVNIIRDGRQQSLSIPSNMAEVLTKHENKGKGLYTLRLPNIIEKVNTDSPAEKAGLKAGDKITSVNGVSTNDYIDFVRSVQGKKNEAIEVTYLRNGASQSTKVNLDDNGKLGFYNVPTEKVFEYKKERYSLFESIPKGISMGVNFLTSQFKAFGKMGRGEIKAKDSLGSIVSMATMFDSSWDWKQFWNITGSLSMILGFMNLLPIPGLDGGYVMFTLWEMITGRKVSDRTMEIATTIGFILLMTLMVFALGNDIRKLF